MRSFTSCAALLLACAFVPIRASAAVREPAITSPPSPANSISPACISLVGHTGAVAARAIGEFTVIIRDLANNPQVGAEVSVDLSLCTDLMLASDQLDPDAIVDCAHHKVTKFTGVDGSVKFTVIGGSNGAGNAVGLLGVGKIFWGQVLIGSPTVSAYDLDSSGGVGANDLSAWLSDFGSAVNYGRSDYDCSGGLGANDLSFWLAAFGSGTMTESGTLVCP